MKNVYIIGGGPAGMMAAISLKLHHNVNVTILEKNAQLGRKLLLTGGGRCNLTANVDSKTVIDNTPKNSKFLYSCMKEFGPQSIIEFFKSHGLDLIEEEKNKIFPASLKSMDVLKTLMKVINQLNIKILFNQTVSKIDVVKKIISSDKEIFKFDKLIIAAGGITYPVTGSDGSGFRLSSETHHHIINPKLSLVPLVSNDLFIQKKALQGLSFKDINISISGRKSPIIKDDLIFTHYGISGPAVLKISYYVVELLSETNNIELKIDFLPDINHIDITQELVNKYIPKRMIDFLKEKNLNFSYLKDFKINIYTNKGINDAFVTNGGVDTKEIDHKTMRSKVNEDISFAGEIIDVNANTGGYNLTICFATGFVAGKYLF